MSFAAVAALAAVGALLFQDDFENGLDQWKVETELPGETLLEPNRRQTISIISEGMRIRYLRDDQVLFDHHDPDPYTSGWFALRTTQSHLRIQELRIYALVPLATK